MNTERNVKSRFHYKGYLNPKNMLPRESILYHIGSIFISLPFIVILYFSGTDPVLASSCGVMLAAFFFLLLFKLNNYYFLKDRKILEHLVVFNKIDTISLLSEFFRELQKAFEASSTPYFGTCDSTVLQATDISYLFIKIFREDGEQLYNQFKLHNGNFFRFIELLTPFQREILYRYYLNNFKGNEGA